MNKTEVKAKHWLEKQGYKNIIFQNRRSPDFLVSEGIGFEVKFVRRNTVTFSRRQWHQLHEHPNVKILFWADGDEPLHIVPIGKLQEPPSYWHQYRLILADLSRRLYEDEGKELKEMRLQLELSQEQLAKKLETSAESVCRWENGHCRPYHVPYKKLQRLLRKAKK